MQAAVASLLDALLALHPSPQEAAWRLRWTIASLPRLASTLSSGDSTHTPVSQGPSTYTQPKHGQEPGPLMYASSSKLPLTPAASISSTRWITSDSTGSQAEQAQQQQGSQHTSPGAEPPRSNTPGDQQDLKSADASGTAALSSQAEGTHATSSTEHPVPEAEQSLHELRQYCSTAGLDDLSVLLETAAQQGYQVPPGELRIIAERLAQLLLPLPSNPQAIVEQYKDPPSPQQAPPIQQAALDFEQAREVQQELSATGDASKALLWHALLQHMEQRHATLPWSAAHAIGPSLQQQLQLLQEAAGVGLQAPALWERILPNDEDALHLAMGFLGSPAQAPSQRVLQACLKGDVDLKTGIFSQVSKNVAAGQRALLSALTQARPQLGTWLIPMQQASLLVEAHLQAAEQAHSTDPSALVALQQTLDADQRQILACVAACVHMCGEKTAWVWNKSCSTLHRFLDAHAAPDTEQLHSPNLGPVQLTGLLLAHFQVQLAAEHIQSAKGGHNYLEWVQAASAHLAEAFPNLGKPDMSPRSPFASLADALHQAVVRPGASAADLAFTAAALARQLQRLESSQVPKQGATAVAAMHDTLSRQAVTTRAAFLHSHLQSQPMVVSSQGVSGSTQPGSGAKRDSSPLAPELAAGAATAANAPVQGFSHPTGPTLLRLEAAALRQLAALQAKQLQAAHPEDLVQVLTCLPPAQRPPQRDPGAPAEPITRLVGLTQHIAAAALLRCDALGADSLSALLRACALHHGTLTSAPGLAPYYETQPMTPAIAPARLKHLIAGARRRLGALTFDMDLPAAYTACIALTTPVPFNLPETPSNGAPAGTIPGANMPTARHVGTAPERVSTQTQAGAGDPALSSVLNHFAALSEQQWRQMTGGVEQLVPGSPEAQRAKAAISELQNAPLRAKSLIPLLIQLRGINDRMLESGAGATIASLAVKLFTSHVWARGTSNFTNRLAFPGPCGSVPGPLALLEVLLPSARSPPIPHTLSEQHRTALQDLLGIVVNLPQLRTRSPVMAYHLGQQVEEAARRAHTVLGLQGAPWQNPIPPPLDLTLEVSEDAERSPQLSAPTPVAVQQQTQQVTASSAPLSRQKLVASDQVLRTHGAEANRLGLARLTALGGGVRITQGSLAHRYEAWVQAVSTGVPRPALGKHESRLQDAARACITRVLRRMAALVPRVAHARAAKQGQGKGAVQLFGASSNASASAALSAALRPNSSTLWRLIHRLSSPTDGDEHLLGVLLGGCTKKGGTGLPLPVYLHISHLLSTGLAGQPLPAAPRPSHGLASQLAGPLAKGPVLVVPRHAPLVLPAIPGHSPPASAGSAAIRSFYDAFESELLGQSVQQLARSPASTLVQVVAAFGSPHHKHRELLLTRLMNLIDYKVSRDGETLSPEDVLTLLRGTGAAQYADVNLLDVALSQLKQAALQDQLAPNTWAKLLPELLHLSHSLGGAPSSDMLAIASAMAQRMSTEDVVVLARELPPDPQLLQAMPALHELITRQLQDCLSDLSPSSLVSLLVHLVAQARVHGYRGQQQAWHSPKADHLAHVAGAVQSVLPELPPSQLVILAQAVLSYPSASSQSPRTHGSSHQPHATEVADMPAPLVNLAVAMVALIKQRLHEFRPPQLAALLACCTTTTGSEDLDVTSSSYGQQQLSKKKARQQREQRWLQQRCRDVGQTVQTLGTIVCRSLMQALPQCGPIQVLGVLTALQGSSQVAGTANTHRGGTAATQHPGLQYPELLQALAATVECLLSHSAEPQHHVASQQVSAGHHSSTGIPSPTGRHASSPIITPGMAIDMVTAIDRLGWRDARVYSLCTRTVTGALLEVLQMQPVDSGHMQAAGLAGGATLNNAGTPDGSQPGPEQRLSASYALQQPEVQPSHSPPLALPDSLLRAALQEMRQSRLGKTNRSPSQAASYQAPSLQQQHAVAAVIAGAAVATAVAGQGSASASAPAAVTRLVKHDILYQRGTYEQSRHSNQGLLSLASGYSGEAAGRPGHESESPTQQQQQQADVPAQLADDMGYAAGKPASAGQLPERQLGGVVHSRRVENFRRTKDRAADTTQQQAAEMQQEQQNSTVSSRQMGMLLIALQHVGIQDALLEDLIARVNQVRGELQ